jgi:hypothetical protein
MVDQTMGADSSFEVSLSEKGLANLSRNVCKDNFSFIVGEEQYRCPSFIAAFLSCRFQANDPTLCVIVIKALDPNHYFESSVSLGFGSSLTVTTEDCDFIRSICSELCNREVFECILHSRAGELTYNKVFGR